MQYKFYVKEVPDPYSVWNWIKKQTPIVELAKKITPSVDTYNLINLNHQFNVDELAATTLAALDKFGFHGWRHATGAGKEYGGLSLSMNPDYAEECDPNQQTLGTPVNGETEFFYGQTKKFKSIRNTYFDTYGFRHHSPCVTETGLLEFIKGFKRSATRGRLAVINSEYVPPEARDKFGWHKDEIIFENLRVNIPIKTDETFMFQLLNKPPEHLHYGNMYSWDTNLAHRVFPTTQETKSRLHIVLGFSPWFDYDEVEDSWTSNEFFGEMHPMDMLVHGHVHEKIKGIK
jgi:hypothetical protein